MPPSAAGSHGGRRVTGRWALIAVDAAALGVGSLSAVLTAGPAGAGRQLSWALLWVLALLLLFTAYGLHDRDHDRVGHRTLDDAPAIFHALLGGTLGLWALLQLTPAEDLTVGQALTFLLLNLVLVLLARAAVRRLLPRARHPERVLLVGTGPHAERALRKLRGRPHLGLLAVGYLEDDEVVAGPPLPLPRLGVIADFAMVCRTRRIERALVAPTATGDDVVVEVVREAKQQDVKVSVLPPMVDVLGPATELDDLEGITLLGIRTARSVRPAALVKRSMDVVISAIGLLLLLPLLPFVALAIKLDSRGPVFFVQDRMGRAGRHFRLWKLRTMVPDAEARAEELRARSTHAAWLMLERDPRVTPLGRFLRLTSIDELPQLWNVLRGEMSLVGPRPMPLDTDRHIRGWARQRLEVKPGLTGPWQVLGRTAIPFEEMLKLDCQYATNWSLRRDVEILLRTALVVVARRGAN